MTVWYSQELQGFASLPVVKPSASQYAGGVYIYQASILLTTQLIADTIVVGYIPSGAAFLFGLLSTDTSLGSSTISIGTAASAAKYRAAAVFTTTNTPTFVGLVANSANVSLTSPETQIITIAVANLPASGNLLYQQFWAAQG
jgi:hypothetical protein